MSTLLCYLEEGGGRLWLLAAVWAAGEWSQQGKKEKRQETERDGSSTPGYSHACGQLCLSTFHV